MKILVADKISASGIAYLREQSEIEMVEAYGSDGKQILKLAADAEAIIVRSATEITSEVIAGAQRLTVIGRAGVGVDNIDVDAASERGIAVLNTPGGNTVATAELTFSHMLCVARPISQATASMKTGKWDRKDFAGSELYQKMLGIIGLGRIGAEVALRAQAFGMRVLAHDPYLTEDRAKALDVKKVELDTLLGDSDIITLHLPLNDTTRHLIDAGTFAKMKDGVRILNCARGGLINEDDLVDAIESGKVAAVGLDVFEKEPLPKNSKLNKLSNVILTPHLGASTREAQDSVGLEIAEAVVEVLRGGILRNAVNIPSVDTRTLKILRPYLVLGEKLGTALQQLSPPQIDKLKITYWGRIVELDAMPLTRSIQRGYLGRISSENINDINAPHVMKRLGIEVEITKSNSEKDYTDLVRVEAHEPGGNIHCIEGTLFGTAHKPRLVNINDREVEASLLDDLLVIANQDVPGIIGMIGMVLGKHKVNIANMSLSRNAVGGVALTVLELDALPSREPIDEITGHEAINDVYLVKL